MPVSYSIFPLIFHTVSVGFALSVSLLMGVFTNTIFSSTYVQNTQRKGQYACVYVCNCIHMYVCTCKPDINLRKKTLVSILNQRIFDVSTQPKFTKVHT